MKSVSPHIQFLPNSEINKAKWNDSINLSQNKLIYARSFYLDNIAPGWDALTGENYEWVLPLTARTKFGITYLYQPPFTQQLGVFYQPGVVVPYKEIIEYLQHQYRFCEVNWNYEVSALPAHLSLQITTATNFILDLSANYKNTAASYHGDLVRNLKRSKRFQLSYREQGEYDKSIQLYREQYGKRMPHVNNNDYDNFKKICSYCSENGMLICREAVDEQGTMMATVLLLVDGKRIYNLMNSTTDAGRKSEANHFLLDGVIKEFSGKDFFFDFEGSDLPGVKNFYQNFGSINQPYFTLKYNLLPWPLKLLKK
ncbi:hypothetical protein [Segetibacter sp.]|uniref:hypothetical protein n=1 Tax=Segetibacter sp. TaxID=2231182 RepID=UPI0026302D35|nr:hypothetical protein [Segetibacter sp.]MCW3079850.1 hypothetical protein [Segetibacter sp.]